MGLKLIVAVVRFVLKLIASLKLIVGVVRSVPGDCQGWQEYRKVDVRLPGKGNSNSHGARPVHLIITMIKWIRTSRLSIKKSLSLAGPSCRTLRRANATA